MSPKNVDCCETIITILGCPELRMVVPCRLFFTADVFLNFCLFHCRQFYTTLNLIMIISRTGQQVEISKMGKTWETVIPTAFCGKSHR